MLYPLRFQPHLRLYPFGGYRIGRVLAREGTPVDRPLAESWEISALPGSESVIKNGPLAGLGLREAAERLKADLVGDALWTRYGSDFPLLVKFLDAAKTLPPQVHPDDDYALKVGLPFPGKSEAWYILQSDPGAYVWCGSRPGLTRGEFRAFIEEGRSFTPMKQWPTRAGETYFVPAGRLHAIGPGNLILEVQQSSDAVFVWDWLDWHVDERRRKSEREHSLAVALLEDGPEESVPPVTVRYEANTREYLVACRHFVMERLTIKRRWSLADDAGRFAVLIPITGTGRLVCGVEQVQTVELLRAGEPLLIPAKLDPVSVEPENELQLLRVTVPTDLETEVVRPLLQAGIAASAILKLGGYGSRNDLRHYLE